MSPLRLLLAVATAAVVVAAAFTAIDPSHAPEPAPPAGADTVAEGP